MGCVWFTRQTGGVQCTGRDLVVDDKSEWPGAGDFLVHLWSIQARSRSEQVIVVLGSWGVPDEKLRRVVGGRAVRAMPLYARGTLFSRHEKSRTGSPT